MNTHRGRRRLDYRLVFMVEGDTYSALVTLWSYCRSSALDTLFLHDFEVELMGKCIFIKAAVQTLGHYLQFHHLSNQYTCQHQQQQHHFNHVSQSRQLKVSQ